MATDPIEKVLFLVPVICSCCRISFLLCSVAPVQLSCSVQGHALQRIVGRYSFGPKEYLLQRSDVVLQQAERKTANVHVSFVMPEMVTAPIDQIDARNSCHAW